MSGGVPAAPGERSFDPKRHPAALSIAIGRAWRPYRWRAYLLGVLAGLLAGGVIAPIVTTSLLFVLYFAGATSLAGGRWADVSWTVAFAVTVPAAGAAAFARWQPQSLRMAAQTYIWLAVRAEENWSRVFGAQPVPRDERGMRAMLATIPTTPETSSERFGLWIALLEIDHARAAIALMPESSAHERFTRGSALWLVDFVEGTTHPLDALDTLAENVEAADDRLEAVVNTAVNRARDALAEGRDWQGPLAAVRGRLGSAPEVAYRRVVWQPTLRTLFISTGIAVTVFWIAVAGLERYF